jgi:hypothetical protein
MATKKSSKAAPKLPGFIINQTDTGRVHVQVNEYKGKLSVDIRHYYKDKATGEFKPTPKGCSVPIEKLKSLKIRMAKLYVEADEQGLTEITES